MCLYVYVGRNRAREFTFKDNHHHHHHIMQSIDLDQPTDRPNGNGRQKKNNIQEYIFSRRRKKIRRLF